MAGEGDTDAGMVFGMLAGAALLTILVAASGDGVPVAGK